MTLRWRLLLSLVPTTLVLFGAWMLASLDDSEQAILARIGAESSQLAQRHSRELDVLFASSAKVADGIATAMATMVEPSAAAVDGVLRRTVEENPQLFGAAVAFVPEATTLGRHASYVYHRGGRLVRRSLDTPQYDYSKWEWYHRPVRTGRGWWSEPYLDEGGGNVLMVTRAVPIRRAGLTIGVATVDLSLTALVDRLQRLLGDARGYGFIVSSEGRVVAHPHKPLLSRETLGQLAERSTDADLAALATLVRTPAADSLEMGDPFSDRRAWVTATLIESTGWTLTTVYPTDQVLRPIRRLERRAVEIAIIAAVLLVLLLLVVSSSVAAPLSRLVRQANQYARGRLERQLPEDQGVREVRELSCAFNRMGRELGAQMDEVRRTTAQKERYRHELVIASELQQSILPRSVPPFPDLAGHIDLVGTVQPATEVSGDYYDFFRLTADRIGVVVADVSDKGAPSALFMSMARMLVRDGAERGASPAQVLYRANQMLERDNSAAMFVTLLYGEVHVSSGRVRVVSAGHPPPLLVGENGALRSVAVPPGLPLGAMPDSHYVVSEFELAVGEVLLLYTDGVTEAMDAEGQPYGLERLREVARGACGQSCQRMVEGVLDSVALHAAGRAASDDLTLVALRRREAAAEADLTAGVLPDGAVRLDVPARTDVLENLALVVGAMARGRGLGEQPTAQLVLALDEVATNVISHSYPADSNERFLVEFVPLSDGLCVVVTDHGVPFDFATESRRYRGDASPEQPLGGIGLHLAQQSVDEFHYEPGTPMGNRLTLVKRG